MGLHVTIEGENKKVDVWACLSSGCATYVESEFFVEASIDDNKKDGLRIRKSVSLRKREGWSNCVHNIINDSVQHTGGEAKADEGELLEIFRFVSEKYRKGYWYIGIKSEFVTFRGIRVYFRIRNHEKSRGHHVIVELIAEKDGERLVYQVYGDTEKAHILLEEITRAIGAYVLFSEYVAKQTDQQND